MAQCQLELGDCHLVLSILQLREPAFIVLLGELLALQSPIPQAVVDALAPQHEHIQDQQDHDERGDQRPEPDTWPETLCIISLLIHPFKLREVGRHGDVRVVELFLLPKHVLSLEAQVCTALAEDCPARRFQAQDKLACLGYAGPQISRAKKRLPRL